MSYLFESCQYCKKRFRDLEVHLISNSLCQQRKRRKTEEGRGVVERSRPPLSAAPPITIRPPPLVAVEQEVATPPVSPERDIYRASPPPPDAEVVTPPSEEEEEADATEELRALAYTAHKKHTALTPTELLVAEYAVSNMNNYCCYSQVVLGAGNQP